ncbi:MAG: HAD family hydrolase [Holophagae bacterium]|nr:HAD family hydrolase [Holophagae bacterium]
MTTGKERELTPLTSSLKIITKGSNRPLSAFLMDVDNTLVDVKRRDYQSFCDTASEMGFPSLDFEEFVNMRLSGASSRTIGTTFLSRHGKLSSLESFLDVRHSRLDRPELFQLDVLFPGAADALGKISAMEIPIVAATLRYDRQLLEEELVRIGILDYFSGILTAGDIRGHADRPYEPEYDCLCYYKGLVLEEALNRFGLVAERTAFVSDTEFDIEAGATLGLITVAVETGYGKNERLRELATVLLSSVSALPELLIFGS